MHVKRLINCKCVKVRSNFEMSLVFPKSQLRLSETVVFHNYLCALHTADIHLDFSVFDIADFDIVGHLMHSCKCNLVFSATHVMQASL